MFSFGKVLLLIFLVLFLSCLYPAHQTSPPALDQNTGQNERRRPPPPPKVPDPYKQAECRKQSRRACGDKRNCRGVCTDIFSKRDHRENCEKLPEDFVFAFEDLLHQVEKGDVQSLDLEVLDCMLDIDDRAFIQAIKKLSRGEAKDVLAEIAVYEDLAQIIKGEDDHFRIFKQLFQEAFSGHDLSRVLTEEIEDDRSFLELSSLGNEYAFAWLDDYVSEECSSSLCPQGQNLGAYCAALVQLNDRDLRDFFSDDDIFAEEYEEEITDQGFDYDASGFRSFCSNEFASSSLSPSPSPTPDPTPDPTCSIPDFCSRTAEVQTAILGRISGKTCCTVTQADLDTIVTELRVPLDPHIRPGYATCQSTATLQADDFSGLRRLTHINFASSCLSNLPSGIFSGMTDLERIEFEQTNELGRGHSTDPTNRGFPADVFNGLSNLQTIHMPECGSDCSTIPACASADNRGVAIIEDC